MKHSMLLIHPKTPDQVESKNGSIFQNARTSGSLPSIHKSTALDRTDKLYDFVGPMDFKLKKFFPAAMRTTDALTARAKDKPDNLSKKPQDTLQQTALNFSKMANTTINRQTILSKLTKHEQIEATKQRRNIDRYKDYQAYWDNQATKMKQLINKKRASVVEDNKKVIVEDNPDKEDIINNYIVHYWEMSLRNHNAILKRHIKGNRYDEIELEEKLQMNGGTKEVEASIPKLPLEALKKVKTRQLSLTGRSKSVMESQTMTERSSLVGFSTRDILNQEEVYIINYEGQKKWQGTEQFY